MNRSHPPRVGILGGMGPRATHYFTGELLSAIERTTHPAKDQDYPHFVVDYACHVPDRTASLHDDRDGLVRAIKSEAAMLSGLGCELLVMPCMTAHAVLDSPEFRALPFLDLRRLVANHLRSRPPCTSVGVLATRGARLAGTTRAMVPAERDAIHLSASEEQDLMSFIYEAAKTWTQGQTITPVKVAIDRLRGRGCDMIVAGCTELEMCLARSAEPPPGVVFPLRLAAEAIVELIEAPGVVDLPAQPAAQAAAFPWSLPGDHVEWD